jgi:elongation factor Ts
MADFTAKDIQKLRHDAGVGMMDAKKALADSDGDLDQAFDLLRERGQAKMAKRADREAVEGVIGSQRHTETSPRRRGRHDGCQKGPRRLRW